MAISTSGGGFGGGGFGSRRRAGGSSLAEINVTPFVDVVLVLLIIFMLTAHVMEFGIQIDVPKVSEVKDSAQELPVVHWLTQYILPPIHLRLSAAELRSGSATLLYFHLRVTLTMVS